TGTACNAPASAPLVGPVLLSGNVVVSTTGASAGVLRGTQPHHYPAMWWTAAVAAAILLLHPRRGVRDALLIVGAAVMVATMISCGNGGTANSGQGPRGPTPSGTFPFTVTATFANNTSRSMQLTLVVK